MMSTALILGFDTSGPYCAAALLCGDVSLAARHEDMAKGQAECLMPMLEEVLAEAGVAWGDLDALGVGIGPGNFTGIRISVAAARGLSLGLGVPAIGVSILEAAAFEADRPVLACMDAKRGQGYFQRFGYGDPAPLLASIDDLEPVEGLTCIGTLASEAATRLGARHVPARYAPASAVARVAATRVGRDQPRPAPLYIRSADAAPSRTPAPTLLPG